MHLHLWRRSLQGRVTRQRLIAGAMALAVVVGLLTTSTLLARHTAAAPGQHTTTLTMQASSGTPRLEVFETYQGFVMHKWSDDNGATWSPWAGLATPGTIPFLVGTPAVVSDGPGLLSVFARDTRILYAAAYVNGSWSSWTPIDAGSYVSDPVITSWGPGRRDLFIAYQTSNNALALKHIWFDGFIHRETLDVPVTGMQGNPAVASTGPGHLDVFVRGGTNELEDKWFANGSWHQGWANLGTPSPTVTLTSSLSAASPGSGLLDVFARGADGGLWHLGFYTSDWGGWGMIDCCLAGDVTNPVAVVSSAASTLTVFAILTDEALYGRGYSYATNSWGPWQPIAPTYNANMAAAVWTLPPPPPSPTPTAPPGQTPTPRGGCFVSCPG